MSIENDWMKLNEWTSPYYTELEEDPNHPCHFSVLYARRSDLKWVQPTRVEGKSCFYMQVGARFVYTLENPLPELENL